MIFCVAGVWGLYQFFPMTGVLKSRIHLPECLQGTLPALPLSAAAVGVSQVRKEFSRRLMLGTPGKLGHVMTHIGTYTDFLRIFIPVLNFDW